MMDLLGMAGLFLVFAATAVLAIVYALDPLTKVFRGVGMTFGYVLVRALMAGLFALIAYICLAFLLNNGP